ncbi:MAG: FUSC family protein [Geodermatophilaceae bacterium]|nr:FUSC family protein [Geodermatophilaceae bacterium]
MTSPPRIVGAAQRLRVGAPFVIEATLAATLAWLVATQVLGHVAPFFAPAAALIVLGQVRGQRVLRMIEVLFGVAGGILVADIVATLLGPGTALTVAVVILLVLIAVTAVGGGPLLLVQGSVSGLYVAVIAPPTTNWVPLRFIDALVGGGIALLASQLSRPGDPLAPLIVTTRRVLDEVAGIVESTAEAVADGDVDRVRAALTRARTSDTYVDGLRREIAAARESLWVHRGRRQRRSRVDTVEAALSQVDYVARNVRVLVRAAVGVATLHPTVPPQVTRAMCMLAEAIRSVALGLAAELTGDEEAARRHVAAAERTVTDAVTVAGQLLPAGQALPVVMIVGQLRSCALDLLRASGVDAVDSLTRVDRALGMPPV